MKKLFITLSVLFFGLINFPGNAQAAPAITVTFGPGFPISETNLAPGQIFERTFSVTNLTDNDQDLMIRFDDQAGPWHFLDKNIEDMTLVQLQEPDGTLADMPNGTTGELLKDLYAFDQAFLFDTLPGTDKDPNDYKLIFTFSKDAGNDYQNKKTVFDLAVGIDSEPVPANNPAHHHHHNDNGTTGTTALVAGLATGLSGATATGVVGGAETPQLEGAEAPSVPLGEVAGEENCQPVAWYIFALLLLAYLFLINLNFWHKFKEQKEPRRFWEIVLTVLAFIGWYYLDICRTNGWFVYAMIIAGFVSYLIYLHYFKKKLEDEDSKSVY